LKISPRSRSDGQVLRGGEGGRHRRRGSVKATRIKKETASVSIRTEEARKVPGTQGDTLRWCRTSGRRPLGIRLGGPDRLGLGADETRVFVDGVDIPALYHGGTALGRSTRTSSSRSS